jgi:catechol 2,3-dioxygenase
MLMSATTPMQVGLVTLNVRQLDRVADYYRNLLGLELIGRDGNTMRLGTGQTPLLELRGNADFVARNPSSAGLFHTAFLMPSREDLGAWLRYVANARIPVDGASDHLVSEALYLTDPEGNGIEVYADRPRSEWQTDGKSIAMTTDPLDIPNLLDLAPAKSWNGAPEGFFVGHMHLQVGNVSEAQPFYSGVLGTDVTATYPGAAFYGAGGYHHQLATNMWGSRGAGPIDPKTTGLVGFELILDNNAQRDAILERAQKTETTLKDPSGLEISLTSKEA